VPQSKGKKVGRGEFSQGSFTIEGRESHSSTIYPLDFIQPWLNACFSDESMLSPPGRSSSVVPAPISWCTLFIGPDHDFKEQRPLKLNQLRRACVYLCVPRRQTIYIYLLTLDNQQSFETHQCWGLPFENNGVPTGRSKVQANRHVRSGIWAML
jgi:hypothetical protein